MTTKPWWRDDRWRRWLTALLDLLYPPHCVACRAPGAWFCAQCIERTPWIEPLDAQRASVTTHITPISSHAGDYLIEARSAAYHLPPIQQAVHALKYEGVRALADPLGDLLAAYWQRHPAAASVIVPVPLHPQRLRERGYNQAELLAQVLGTRLSLPVHSAALVRERDTRSQVGLSARERWANVSDAFCCQESLFGADVLLIDDVFTTGATLQACAQALLQQDAHEVRALTLTRALDPSDRASGI